MLYPTDKKHEYQFLLTMTLCTNFVPSILAYFTLIDLTWTPKMLQKIIYLMISIYKNVSSFTPLQSTINQNRPERI